MCCDPPEELLQPLHPLAEELVAEVVKVLEQLLTGEGLERRGEERGEEGRRDRDKREGKGGEREEVREGRVEGGCEGGEGRSGERMGRGVEGRNEDVEIAVKGRGETSENITRTLQGTSLTMETKK